MLPFHSLASSPLSISLHLHALLIFNTHTHVHITWSPFSLAHRYTCPGLITWNWKPLWEHVPGGDQVSLSQQTLTTHSSSSRGGVMPNLRPRPRWHVSWHCHCAGCVQATLRMRTHGHIFLIITRRHCFTARVTVFWILQAF